MHNVGLNSNLEYCSTFNPGFHEYLMTPTIEDPAEKFYQWQVHLANLLKDLAVNLDVGIARGIDREIWSIFTVESLHRLFTNRLGRFHGAF